MTGIKRKIEDASFDAWQPSAKIQRCDISEQLLDYGELDLPFDFPTYPSLYGDALSFDFNTALSSPDTFDLNVIQQYDQQDTLSENVSTFNVVASNDDVSLEKLLFDNEIEPLVHGLYGNREFNLVPPQYDSVVSSPDFAPAENVSSFNGSFDALLLDELFQEKLVTTTLLLEPSKPHFVQNTKVDDDFNAGDYVSMIQCFCKNGRKGRYCNKSHATFSDKCKIGKSRKFNIHFYEKYMVNKIQIKLVCDDVACFYLTEDEHGDSGSNELVLPCDGSDKSFYLVPIKDSRGAGIKGVISHRLDILYYLNDGNRGAS